MQLRKIAWPVALLAIGVFTVSTPRVTLGAGMGHSRAQTTQQQPNANDPNNQTATIRTTPIARTIPAAPTVRIIHRPGKIPAEQAEH